MARASRKRTELKVENRYRIRGMTYTGVSVFVSGSQFGGEGE